MNERETYTHKQANKKTTKLQSTATDNPKQTDKERGSVSLFPTINLFTSPSFISLAHPFHPRPSSVVFTSPRRAEGVSRALVCVMILTRRRCWITVEELLMMKKNWGRVWLVLMFCKSVLSAESLK